MKEKRERGGREGAKRETGRERIPSRLLAVSAEPDVGLDPTNRAKTQELDAYPTEPPRHPCRPHF